MADLSTSIIRGCAASDKIFELSTRLDGYQSKLDFCNSTNFCNSASKIAKKLTFRLLVFYILEKIFFNSILLCG